MQDYRTAVTDYLGQLQLQTIMLDQSQRLKRLIGSIISLRDAHNTRKSKNGQ